MYRKILILSVLIACIFSGLHAQVREKASSKFADDAKVIALVAVTGLRDDQKAIIAITNPHSDNLEMSIIYDHQYIVNGSFSLNFAATYNDIVIFQGKGINEITGQEIQFDLYSDDSRAELLLSKVNKKEYFKCPVTEFKAADFRSETGVVFHDTPFFSNYVGPGWKRGSFKQLKQSLLKNPFVDYY